MLRDADQLLVPKVEATLGALELAPADAALVRLVRDYAAAIDKAAELAADVEAAEGTLDPDDIIGRRQLAELARKVERQAVLATLGPKLLAALEALGATPAARNRGRAGGGGHGGDSRLQALREARRA
jgi:hypothetical protein